MSSNTDSVEPFVFWNHCLRIVKNGKLDILSSTKSDTIVLYVCWKFKYSFPDKNLLTERIRWPLLDILIHHRTWDHWIKSYIPLGLSIGKELWRKCTDLPLWCLQPKVRGAENTSGKYSSGCSKLILFKGMFKFDLAWPLTPFYQFDLGKKSSHIAAWIPPPPYKLLIFHS